MVFTMRTRWLGASHYPDGTTLAWVMWYNLAQHRFVRRRMRLATKDWKRLTAMEVAHLATRT